MNKNTWSAAWISVFLLVSCATTPSPTSFQKSEVVERMGDASDTPKWTFGETSMVSEGSDVIFISTMTMGGDSRPEACLKAAELDSRSAFVRHIQEAVTTSGQVNDQNVASDPAYESLTAFLAQGKISGAKTSARYWEKVAQSNESGERVLKLRCAVKVAVKRSDLERQLRVAMGDQGNKEIRAQLIKAQKQFIENIGSSEGKE